MLGPGRTGLLQGSYFDPCGGGGSMGSNANKRDGNASECPRCGSENIDKKLTPISSEYKQCKECGRTWGHTVPVFMGPHNGVW